MKFREFFKECTFTLLECGVSNWDYYIMQYKNEKPVVTALAKPGTGADDCFYGDLKYFYRQKNQQAD